MDKANEFSAAGPLTIVLNRHLQLVQQYRAVKAIPPVIKQLQQSPADYRMFQETLNNHYKMLLGRSRNFYDNEVSCFDTAFMELMLDAKTHPGALSIYVDEIIGLKPLSQPQKPEVLRSAVRVRTMFVNLATKKSAIRPASITCPDPHPLGSVTGAAEGNERAPLNMEQFFTRTRHPQPSATHPNSTTSSHNDGEPQTLAIQSQHSDTSLASGVDDPKLVKLLALYHSAKAETKAIESHGSPNLASSRFLRDTAENCIQYMESVNPHDARLAELRETFRESTTAVERRYHGLKRRFDYEWEGTPKGPVVPTPISRREKKRLRGREVRRFADRYVPVGDGKGEG